MNQLVKHATERFARDHRLTQRESDIFSLLVDGVGSASGLARALKISENTINNHFKNLYRRTDTNSRTELMSLFIRESLDRWNQSLASDANLANEGEAEIEPFRTRLSEPRPSASRGLERSVDRPLPTAFARDTFALPREHAS